MSINTNNSTMNMSAANTNDIMNMVTITNTIIMSRKAA